MITLYINGRQLTAREGQTILEAAETGGVKIPTLCHDESVKPQGACGMCAVEIEGFSRLIRACATAAADGMIIQTDTERVRASRRSALELLLSAHTGDCLAPCRLACPAHTDCQGYIAHIAKGRYREALELMKEAHPLPASIGRVCPRPCEDECRRELADEPINIAGLKYFAADTDSASEPYIPETAADTGKSAAVIGGGPAGLTAAYFLRRAGHSVTVFDAMERMGGLLRYGIPEYRLPKDVLDKELAVLRTMGIIFRNGVKLGRDMTLEALRGEYGAVIIATGAGVSKKLGCKGEELSGVLGGIDFLRDAATGKPVNLGEKVIVAGGSNTAIDAARTAARLGASEVTIVYRRTRNEMPAEPEEIAEAEKEGVKFKFLVNPLEITGADNRVTGARLQIMALGEPDESGRRSPVPVEGAEETVAADTVIAAIGQDINLSGLESLKTTRRGAVAADERTYATDLPGVYAIGDVTGRSAYAIEAIGHARKAAAAADAYLTGADKSAYITDIPDILVKDIKTKDDFKDEPRLPRGETPLNAEAAMREASRCLSCGCGDFKECKLIELSNEYNAGTDVYGGENCEKIRVKPDVSHKSIIREPNKCILCGLCVRVCDEAAGKTVFGIMNRGFNSVAAPAFDAPLAETDCDACGKCVVLCPTGALQTRNADGA